MKVLIVDDNSSRHEFIELRDGQNEYHHAYSYQQAVEMLSEQSPFDMVHLDWDLGQSVEISGAQVVEFILLLALNERPHRVNCHSSSPEARRNMAQRLHDAGIKATCGRIGW